MCYLFKGSSEDRHCKELYAPQVLDSDGFVFLAFSYMAGDSFLDLLA